MAVEVKIPPMGESITGGLLASWTVKSGDAVRKGQPLFSYETDKVTSEGTAEVDGCITIGVPAGTEVSVGQVIATIEAGAAGAAPAPVAAAPKAVSEKSVTPPPPPLTRPPCWRSLVPPPKSLLPFGGFLPRPASTRRRFQALVRLVA